MMPQGPFLAAARQRISPSVLVLLVFGNLLLFVVGVLALLIPDSHAWQLLLSALLALGLVAGLLLWNAAGIRRLRAPASSFPLWAGALSLAAWLLLGALVIHVIGLAEPNIETRAGYWNSQLTSGLRHLLSYTRLITLQQAVVTTLRWVVVPAVLLPFAIETVTWGWGAALLGRASRVLLSLRHWIVALCGLGLAAWVVPALAAWHPSHSVHGEVFSAVLRLGCAGLLAIIAGLTVLAVDAELLHRTARSEPQKFSDTSRSN